MCGIAAIIDTRVEDESPAATARRGTEVLGMLERIRHRGDAEYFGEHRVGTGVAMGTNRLGIETLPQVLIL